MLKRLRPLWPFAQALKGHFLFACLLFFSGTATSALAAPLELTFKAVPLNPQQLEQQQVGGFDYAGGLELTANHPELLHGLSDLEVHGEQLLAVSDLGYGFAAELQLDSAQRLVGLKAAEVSPLLDLAGRPLQAKAAADAEGLALLPNGDRLVSFERQDRIWLYPAGGGLPQPVPAPQAVFADNSGLEALSAAPDLGPDVYLAGAESTGRRWQCQLSQVACMELPALPMPPGFKLVAMKRLSAQRSLYLLRFYDQTSGLTRIRLQVFDHSSLLAQLELSPPLTVDNFEGLAAVPRSDGGLRIYLLSDDNFNPEQRTLLLAFDWPASTKKIS